MKVSILSVLLLCSMAAFSQRIKISETDTTDHICRISTTSKWFDGNAANGFALAVRSENNSIFLQLSAASHTVVADGDVLMFDLDNDSTIAVYSKGLQISSAELKMPIEYLISLAELKMLYQHSVKSVSYYTAGGQRKNIKMSALNEAGLQNVCGIFFKEYLKFSSDRTTVCM